MGIPGLEMECLQSLPFQIKCALKNVSTLCTWMVVFSSHNARPNVSSPHMNLLSFNGTVKLAESKLGGDRVGRVNGRDEDTSRPDLRRPSLPC